MKQFKREYQNVKVTINSPAIGRVSIDTTTADPEKWAKVPEFEFMIEDTEEIKAKPQPAKVKPQEVIDYSELTLNELRELFPNIKSTSKKNFLELIDALK